MIAFFFNQSCLGMPCWMSLSKVCFSSHVSKHRTGALLVRRSWLLLRHGARPAAGRLPSWVGSSSCGGPVCSVASGNGGFAVADSGAVASFLLRFSFLLQTALVLLRPTLFYASWEMSCENSSVVYGEIVEDPKVKWGKKMLTEVSGLFSSHPCFQCNGCCTYCCAGAAVIRYASNALELQMKMLFWGWKFCNVHS